MSIVDKRLTEMINTGLLEIDNNLGYPNTFFSVTGSFYAFIMTGHRPSNASYGNSRIMRPVWKKITLRKGDEIHNIHGGQYYVAKKETPPGAKGVPIRFTSNGKEPYWAAFEKYHIYDKWPLNKMKKLDKNEEKDAKYARN